MNEYNLIVYDTTHGFSRFLKSHFSETYNMQIWKGNGGDVIDLSKYNIAVLQINSYENLRESLILSHFAKHIFWSSSIKEVQKTLQNVDDFIYLDMELDKNSIKSIISNTIELIDSEKEYRIARVK